MGLGGGVGFGLGVPDRFWHLESCKGQGGGHITAMTQLRLLQSSGQPFVLSPQKHICGARVRMGGGGGRK